YDPTGRAVAAVEMTNFPSGVAPACADVPPALAGDLFVNDVDGVLELVDLHHRGAVSVVASGALHGGDLTCGPDGHLYVAEADRVQEILFDGVVSAPSVDVAGREVGPFVAACALLVGTVVLLIAWRWWRVR